MFVDPRLLRVTKHTALTKHRQLCVHKTYCFPEVSVNVIYKIFAVFGFPKVACFREGARDFFVTYR